MLALLVIWVVASVPLAVVIGMVLRRRRRLLPSTDVTVRRTAA